MKTTLNLDDALLREAKKRAAEQGRTLTSIIEQALRAELSAPRRGDGYRFDLPIVRGAAPPTVDVADRDALYERMEGRR